MAPNSYVSTYQGDFGGRQSKSFIGAKQGPSLVARQSKGYTGELLLSDVDILMLSDISVQARATPLPRPGPGLLVELRTPAQDTASSLPQNGQTQTFTTTIGITDISENLSI